MDKVKVLEDALKLHQQGEMQAAQDKYQAILQEYPEETDVLHLLGISFGQLGEYQQAQQHLEQAVRLHPNSPTYLNSLGRVLFHLEQWDAAEFHLRESLQKQAYNPTAHNNLGMLYFAKSDDELAEGHFLQAIHQRPDMADAQFNLGLTLLRRNKLDKARTHFRHTLELQPDHAGAHSQLGQLAQKQDKPAEAIAHYQAQLKADPDDADTHHRLGTAFLAQEDKPAAIKAFEQALKLNPKHAETHHNMGALYLLQNELDNALKHWSKLLEIAPDVDTYYNLGVVYQYKERHADAVHYFLEALSHDPKHLNSHINVAAVYLKRGEIQQACFHYKQALELDPDNQQVRYLLSALLPEENTEQYRRAPEGYVRDLFDQYAPHFEQHLTECLSYEAPQRLFEAVSGSLPTHDDPHKGYNIVDLGCGTGLCGPLFHSIAHNLTGIDLSQRMLDQAATKNVYDALLLGDIVQQLKAGDDADIVIAADTLPYIGDLSEVFTSVAQTLGEGGLFGFTVERLESNDQDFALQTSARFAHSHDYIKRLAVSSHFELLFSQPITTRMEQNTPVPGLLLVLKRVSVRAVTK